MKGFIYFIRTQGIVGLAIGFILGGAVSKVVQSFVTDIVDPIIGSLFGNLKGLSEMSVGAVHVGSFISVLIDFFIVAAVVYFGFKGLRLDRLDQKKEEVK